MAKFSEIFAFLVYFQGRYLKVEVEDILKYDDLQEVIQVEKIFSELREKALQRIRDEKISPEFIWECPYCSEDTFVIEDNQNICFLCRSIAEVVECSHCKKFWFAEQMQDFSDQIESDYADGQLQIHNDYGYSEYDACPDCIGTIRDDIEKQRAEDYYEHMDEEEWYSKRLNRPDEEIQQKQKDPPPGFQNPFK